VPEGLTPEQQRELELASRADPADPGQATASKLRVEAATARLGRRSASKVSQSEGKVPRSGLEGK
jgi:hypothetical protein